MALDVSNLTSTVQAPINNVYMRGLLSAARKRLPYFNGTVPGTLEKKGGSMTVKWRRIENLTAVTTALSEQTENGPLAFGVGRSSVKPTITDLTTAVAKYGNFVILTEEIDLFNISPITAALMDTLGANAGESLNTLARDVMKAGSNIDYVNGVANKSAVAAVINLATIKKSVGNLNRNSAQKFDGMGTGSTNYNSQPIRQSYFGICHTDVEEDIRGLSGFIGVEQYGGYTQTYPNEFGTVGGVRWTSTEIAPVETGGSTTSASTNYQGSSTGLADLYWAFVYGKEAVGTVGVGEQFNTQITEMYDPKKPQAVEIIYAPAKASAADPYGEISTIAWKTWFGGKILNPSWIRSIVSLATRL
jgi:N4-gp56 family major capsid protein